MALKKSELYSSLWSSCDELRGGMDASQYKDYVLVLLFIKYVSDKYAGQPYAPIAIPDGAGFRDMVALKGKPDIGDQINKKIVAPLVKANQQLSLSDFPDFNDPVKLGDGKERQDRLTNLVAIFENPALDFSKNRADDDDILGDRDDDEALECWGCASLRCPAPSDQSRTRSHSRDVKRCGRAHRVAGTASRQEAPDQARRDASVAQRTDSAGRFHRIVV